MATALNKELKREVLIKDKPYTLTLGPTGLKLTLKGHRNGVDLKWRTRGRRCGARHSAKRIGAPRHVSQAR